MSSAVLGIAAPARTCVTGEGWGSVDHCLIDAAEDRLRSMGWQVVEAANVRSLSKRFAGCDTERARGLESLFAAPEVDLVMAVRGGYGTARILPMLDWGLISSSHARFIGLSDATAFSAALYAVAGQASWQGPVASWFAEDNALRDESFRRAMTGPGFEITVPLRVRGHFRKTEGVLWGGNLSVLASLLGTPFFPRVDGGILLVEDAGEPAWRVERMLDQMVNCGVLCRQKALLAGRFKGSERGEGSGAGRFSISDALDYIFRRTGVPVLSGLNFGHVPDSLAIPVGVEAVIEPSAGGITIRAGDPPLPANVPWIDNPASGRGGSNER